MVISIFGKSGAGKTTTATHLGKFLSDKGYFVGIISAEIRFGDIQRRLNTKVSESKTLLNAIIDYKNAENYFTKVNENLYILSVHDTSTIKEYEDIVKILGTKENQSKEQINRIHQFVDSVSDIFDYLIIDCTDRINDIITFAFASTSDKVIHLIESNISGITFCNAHKYLNEFDFYKNKINILNKHYEKAINKSTIESLIEEKIDLAISYRETTVMNNIVAKADEKFMADMRKIDEIILNPSTTVNKKRFAINIRKKK